MRIRDLIEWTAFLALLFIFFYVGRIVERKSGGSNQMYIAGVEYGTAEANEIWGKNVDKSLVALDLKIARLRELLQALEKEPTCTYTTNPPHDGPCPEDMSKESKDLLRAGRNCIYSSYPPRVGPCPEGLTK